MIGKILALDLGTTTGFAFGDAKQCEHGAHNFSIKNHEGAGMRFLRFKNWLIQLIDEIQPEVVYWEEVKRHKGTLAAHIFGGLQAGLMEACEAKQIPYQGLGVTEIKKHATGKGNASKELMIQAAKDMGYEPQDENAADAICIYHYARSL